MKLNVSKILTQFDGITPLKIKLKEGEINLTLKEFLMTILGSNQSKEGKESIHVIKLGMDIFKAKKEIDVTIEDIVLIKKIVNDNKGWTDLPKGQVLMILDEVK